MEFIQWHSPMSLLAAMLLVCHVVPQITNRPSWKMQSIVRMQKIINQSKDMGRGSCGNSHFMMHEKGDTSLDITACG